MNTGGDILGIIVIDIGNEHDDLISNPGQGSLHFI